jgi:rhamnosyltransferase
MEAGSVASLQKRKKGISVTASEPKVVGVLVAYNTPGEQLLKTASRLAPQLLRLLVMDNSDNSTEVALALSRMPIQGVEYHSAGGNVGIAAAQNKGIERSNELDADFVLFLDDDSTFPDDGVKDLLAELAQERKAFPNTAGIGPRIIDERTKQSLVAVWDGAKVRPGLLTHRTEVAYLVSSGALVDADAFEKYGLFRGEYFIDHVDKEWGFRVGLHGGRLVVTPLVTMTHQLGDSPTVTRSGSIRYRHASPTRDYYLTRNAIFLMRDLPLPAIKYFDLLRLLVESSLRKIFGPARTLDQRRAVVHGLVHGLLNRRGPRRHR